MELVIISAPNRIKNEHLILNKLFESGMDIFHLRKPDWDINEIKSLIESIDNKFHNRIVIHSHYELCKTYNLKGIHFTEKTKAFINKYSEWSVQKTISVHSVKEATEIKEKYDYVLLSPFFNSISKDSYKSTFNHKELELWLKTSKLNIVALGGITPQNIKKIYNYNLLGVAVLGYLWKSNIENINQAFYELKHCLLKEQ